MIFVTVGTHEQQFNRLVKKVDVLKGKGLIQEDVFIQTGYSTYEPKYCEWSSLIPYKEMLTKVRDARIIITHGGPASFIMPLQENKIPIVVPRQQEYDEHINNHQIEFATFIESKQQNIIVVLDVEKLGTIIDKYDELVKLSDNQINSNNDDFNASLQNLLEMFEHN
ncbi:glycosyltransferase [Amedibacillus sp. YH-ame10]